jgi:GNAT superfamily N-acetyltransferase
MAREVIIRKATYEDVSSIVELWKELMDFHKERDRIFSRSDTGHESFADYLTGHISKENSYLFVAEAGEDIVGYCLVFIEKYPPVIELQEYCLVQDIAVAEKYRRKGIGKRFLKEAKIWYSEKGIHRVEARVSTYNKAAREFWAEMGFKPYLETVFMDV